MSIYNKRLFLPCNKGPPPFPKDPGHLPLWRYLLCGWRSECGAPMLMSSRKFTESLAQTSDRHPSRRVAKSSSNEAFGRAEAVPRGEGVGCTYSMAGICAWHQRMCLESHSDGWWRRAPFFSRKLTAGVWKYSSAMPTAPLPAHFCNPFLDRLQQFWSAAPCPKRW